MLAHFMYLYLNVAALMYNYDKILNIILFYTKQHLFYAQINIKVVAANKDRELQGALQGALGASKEAASLLPTLDQTCSQAQPW